MPVVAVKVRPTIHCASTKRVAESLGLERLRMRLGVTGIQRAVASDAEPYRGLAGSPATDRNPASIRAERDGS